MTAGLLIGESLVKVFPGGARALDGVSFTARPGSVLSLLGPSGCGKSTLLRIIAGLETATSGSITLDGRPLEGVPPAARDVGFVFQNYALYPHLTVAGNLSLALEVRRVARSERDRRVSETASLLGIEALLDRRPAQLSGGQQQRVAVGRALVRRPRLLLMDEPLSNLDATLRESMRAELRLLFRATGATVIYVTHDQAEAMSLSDTVAVLREGRVVQASAPAELYARPADRFVASFVGSPRMNLWSGERASGRFRAGAIAVELPPGLPDVEMDLGIRPEDVALSPEPRPDWAEAELLTAELLGRQSLVSLRAGGADVRALVDGGPIEGRAWVSLPADRLHWFDRSSGRRLDPGTPLGKGAAGLSEGGRA